jgi:hypothetical protein
MATRRCWLLISIVMLSAVSFDLIFLGGVMEFFFCAKTTLSYYCPTASVPSMRWCRTIGAAPCCMRLRRPGEGDERGCLLLLRRLTASLGVVRRWMHALGDDYNSFMSWTTASMNFCALHSFARTTEVTRFKYSVWRCGA